MWWNQYPDRFRKECAQFKKHFPAVALTRGIQPARYCPVCSSRGATGDIHLAAYARLSTRLGHSYNIILVYPCSSPSQIPQVWSLAPLVPRPPGHMFGDGRLCLTNNEYNPGITGAMVLGWAFGWFNCYDIWRKTGVFPPGNYGRVEV